MMQEDYREYSTKPKSRLWRAGAEALVKNVCEKPIKLAKRLLRVTKSQLSDEMIEVGPVKYVSYSTGAKMNQNILLIDDSEPIHELVISLLGSEPITIHSAFDAVKGIALAASLRPDLILLDIEIPDVDGLEICRRLKADPATSAIPIIFLTARVGTEDLVRGLNLGASDYITKPFKLPELLSRVGAALRTGQTMRFLAEKAMIDPLTCLGNRAMFNERFAAEVSMRIRSGEPLSCIAMDVDHFKGINDKYGHPFGDEALRKVGEAIMGICRVEDTACRYGGEEFMVLAPRTSADHAAIMAERMRCAIANISLSSQGESVTVTCSFGVAEAGGLHDRLLLERADQALYQSKNNGRNRVSVAPAQPPLQSAAA
jgi:two-component system, cell cycle response regulator